ncbi:MAG TPA: tripartite tricarboxylate transporter substrate-binding protein [Hydrogenophaga sp.]|uniref:Bug family tripartite tricarboxylate transporter substrate binding protein n=1 Tax=Hydrogenophaga sp. TaxID=1904254 RepID=UPI002BB0A400|nr:tripartite tricarboxylate transporter substrate-binding protein [Hydrogenophaga sp.]HSX93534.1 tripartite tricarboxylate transporter substrate-binding protein [Hydrogenophaga sp.]
MRRDRFIKVLGATLAGACWSTWADSPPNRLSLLIPASAGGGWDATGRALGAAMLQTGRYREVAYQNKGGAAGTLGLAQFLEQSVRDPNALLVMGAVMVGGLVSSKSPLRLQQATPVARLTSEYSVFAVAAGSAFASMEDVADALHESPTRVRFGGGSKGSTEHIATAMFARSVHVAPRGLVYQPHAGGAEAVATLLRGGIDVVGSGYGELAPELASGRLRLLGISSQRRVPMLPMLPTLKEQGFDVIIGNWRGVYGAPGISPAQRDALIAAVGEAVKQPAWRQAIERHGWTSSFTTGKDFGAFVEFEFAAMSAIMYLSGML